MNSAIAAQLPSVLTGIKLGIDGISSVFLLFTFFIWFISGVYASYYMKGQKNIGRFFLFYIISAAGNIGLILAQDMVSFYLFFALMTFAAYPLIVHDKTAGARYAGKVYIIMAVIGEAMLISAIMMIAAEAESTAFNDIAAAVLLSGNQNIIIGLILAGFGVKAGAIFLHMWLPLAHPVAPTPASAVLSGVMIKAGLLGWIRFLPLGEISLPVWGGLCIPAGLIAAFYGVAAGLAQNNPKTVLAYSSISQMGIMTSGLGIGLSSPDLRSMTVTVLLVYSMYHALNKAALFLGVGVVDRCTLSNRKAVFFLLLLPSLSLAGAPFTGGAVAKVALKTLSGPSNGFLTVWLGWLLPLTSVATTILMGHFLFLLSAKEDVHKVSERARGIWFSWLVLLAFTLAAGWFLPFAGLMNMVRETHTVQNIFSSLGPVLAGAIIWWAVWQLPKRSIIKSGLNMPPGDLLVIIVMILRQVKTLKERNIPKLIETLKTAFPLKKTGLRTGVFVSDVIINAESNLLRWFVACIIFLFTVATLFVFIGH